jgi:hypothetical protein
MMTHKFFIYDREEKGSHRKRYFYWTKATEGSPGTVGFANTYKNFSGMDCGFDRYGQLTKVELDDIIHLLEELDPERLPEFVVRLKEARKAAFIYEYD